MKINQLTIIFSFVITTVNPTAEDILRQMYDQYQDKWFHTLTFSQTTESFRNDSLIKTATWYESIMFPDKFRIDFGSPASGDAVIFRNDSAYRFSKGQLKDVRADKNDLTFLLGGLYFYPFDKIISELKSLHYDLNKFHVDTWKCRDVYVIGADTKDEKLNQLWIDKEKLILVRQIKFDDNRKEEAIFENHILLGGGWSETICTFYINDHLIQKEYYHDCKANVPIDPNLFDPSSFGKNY